MKKIFVFTSFFLASLAGFSQIKDGFSRSESGVLYKVETKNPKGRAVVEGDIVIGNYAVAYGDSLVFSSLGTPAQPTFGAMEANRAFKGDLIDGLFLMKEGEQYTFAFPYDSIAKMQQLPPFFKKGDFAYYTVKIEKLMTSQEFQEEQQRLAKEQQRVADSLQAVEMTALVEYLHKNNYSDVATDGVYYKQISKGGEVKPSEGNKVKVHYAGRFLDGRLFDTSVEEIAVAEGRHDKTRAYQPLEFTIGKHQMIEGFERAVKMMSQGEKGIVVIPSSLAYGARQRGEIAPFSTLVFELELVEVIK